jgi:hypothetical protein
MAKMWETRSWTIVGQTSRWDYFLFAYHSIVMMREHFDVPLDVPLRTSMMWGCTDRRL